jgi:acyl carrier protein
MKETGAAQVTDELRRLLAEVLQLNAKRAALTPESRLLGEIPEFDSMAVVAVITAIEERFGFTVEDDEISADVFETLGTLAAFVEQKIAS